MSEIIFPKNIKKGGKIAIIAPAGSVEENQLQSTLNLIKEHGFEPVLGEHLYGKYKFGYEYSGTEEERISDINWAFNDDRIEAIWAARGGYGCQHLLKDIDLKKFKKNPKWYVGYSDNTVIHSYLLKNNIASINGQTIKTSSFGVSEESYEEIFNVMNGFLPRYLVEPTDLNRNGKAEGQLVGGNLALIYALLGTKYEFPWKNSILFIEDIGENYYALDRMLMSLEMVGVFKKISGLVTGGMINMGKESENENYEDSFDDFANQIIAKRVEKYRFPTLFCFPNGHIFGNLPLVIGANVKLRVGKSNSLKYV